MVTVRQMNWKNSETSSPPQIHASAMDKEAI